MYLCHVINFIFVYSKQMSKRNIDMKQYTSTTTIAIAEDHPLLRHSLEVLITQMPELELIGSFPDGKDVVTFAQAHAIPLELCLVDISMQQYNGFDTVQQLRLINPSIKVIIITGYLEEVYINRMMALGANAFLSKSSEEAEMLKAIRAVRLTGYYYNTFFTKAKLQRAAFIWRNKATLKPREEQLLKHIHTNLTYDQIGDCMGISARSAEGIRDNLFQKFQVNTRQELTCIAINLGYVILSPTLEHPNS
jgi:DNA-binding NarL/FixJ family response regulator